MIDFVILHTEEVPIHHKIFHSVYIFFPEVIGICIINRDTDESFEISIEFQCDILSISVNSSNKYHTSFLEKNSQV